MVAAGLRGDDEGVLLVVEAAGQVIGGIQYHEEDDPMYRHASIDIYLRTDHRGQGALAPRPCACWPGSCWSSARATLTIDPAVANQRAIRCYEKVGFRR